MNRYLIFLAALAGSLGLSGCDQSDDLPPLIEAPSLRTPTPLLSSPTPAPEKKVNLRLDPKDLLPPATPAPAIIPIPMSPVPETQILPVAVPPPTPPSPAPLVARIPVPEKVISFEQPPRVSPKGYDLIIEFEVGGIKEYNRRLQRPDWPGGASGVTIGVGYDLGYNTKAQIQKDWHMLKPETVNRLTGVSGLTGSTAKSRLQSVRDILITWDLAEQVFNEKTIPRFLTLADRTYPGFYKLRPNAQAALLSLTFNRGASLRGPRRTEMRNIVGLVPKKDYEGMAEEIRSMIRIWRGSDIERAMTRRRTAEAKLMLTP